MGSFTEIAKMNKKVLGGVRIKGPEVLVAELAEFYDSDPHPVAEPHTVAFGSRPHRHDSEGKATELEAPYGPPAQAGRPNKLDGRAAAVSKRGGTAALQASATELEALHGPPAQVGQRNKLGGGAGTISKRSNAAFQASADTVPQGVRGDLGGHTRARPNEPEPDIHSECQGPGRRVGFRGPLDSVRKRPEFMQPRELRRTGSSEKDLQQQGAANWQ